MRYLTTHRFGTSLAGARLHSGSLASPFLPGSVFCGSAFFFFCGAGASVACAGGSASSRATNNGNASRGGLMAAFLQVGGTTRTASFWGLDAELTREIHHPQAFFQGPPSPGRPTPI